MSQTGDASTALTSIGQQDHPGRSLLLLAIASLLFLAPLALLPFSGAAQSEAWALLGLRGEAVLALSIGVGDGQRLIYAETQTGLWRYSPAAGWSRADRGLPRGPLGNPALAAWRVVPGRQQQIYAITGTGTARQLYRSDDGGHAWASIGPAPGQIARPAMLVLPGSSGQPLRGGAEPAAASDFITLVTETRVQRSTDGGATWAPGGPWPGAPIAGANGSPAAGGERVWLLLGDASAPERLYALTESGALWISESGGRAWRAASVLPASAAPVAPANGSVASAAGTASTANQPSARLTALAIAPYFGMRIWVAGEERLFFSLDGGAGWTARPLPNARGQGGLITALVCDPRAPETLYAALSDGTVYRTDDAGATWASLGRPGGTRITTLALDPETRSQLYVATGDGVWVRNVLPPQPPAVPVLTATTTAEPMPEDELPGLQPAVATPTATASASPTASPSPSATPSATASATPSRTPTPTPTFTAVPPTPTATLPPTPTATVPPTRTPTPLPPAPAPPAPASPAPPVPTAPAGTPPPR